MNCSSLNAHLHSLHVIECLACVCSHRENVTAHFFLDCPLYYVQRLALRNTVAGDLMLFELIVVRVHCIVCIVCDWRSHDYLVVRI